MAPMSLTEILKPILISMKIFGLYHEGQSTQTLVVPLSKTSEPDKTNHRCSGVLRRLYSIIVLCVLAANILRFIPSFWVGYSYFAKSTVFRVISLGWLIMCFCHCFLCYRMFEKPTHFKSAEQLFNLLVSDNLSNECKMQPECQRLRRLVIILTCSAWVAALINFAAFIMFCFSDFASDFAAVIVNPFPSTIIFKILILIPTFYCCGAWLFPVVFQVILFYIVKVKFIQFKKALEKTVKEENTYFISQLKSYRLKHLQLCNLVSILEKDIQYLLITAVGIGIFLACFILYVLINSKGQGMMEIIVEIFWLVSQFLTVISISITAALVNSQVSIYKIYHKYKTFG